MFVTLLSSQWNACFQGGPDPRKEVQISHLSHKKTTSTDIEPSFLARSSRHVEFDFRARRNWVREEMGSNGTEFSGYSDFPKYEVSE